MRIRVVALAAVVALAVPSLAVAVEPDGAASAAQQAKVELLADFAAGDEADADARAAAVEAVTELRGLDIGWGAIFHLLKLSSAMGVDPAELVGAPGADGEYDFGFGKLRKSLSEDQLETYRGGAKNFGQLKKAARAPKKAQG